jgi:hypothetical protein
MNGPGRPPKVKQSCGVFIQQSNSFCELPVVRYRRCEVHLAQLKRDGRFETMRRLKGAETKNVPQRAG